MRVPMLELRGGWGTLETKLKDLLKMATKKSNQTSPSPCKSQVEGTGVPSSLGKRRRKVDVESIWSMPEQTSLGWAPYLVISSEDGAPNPASLSPFKISAALETCGVRDPLGVNSLRSGDLLVQVRSPIEANALLKMKTFSGIAVTVQRHKTLNSSKGVVKSHELRNCSEKEIVDNVKGITHARRIKIRRDGNELMTNTWIMTFDTPKPPTSLKICYLELEVRPFVPNPMRCFNCQRFGHTKLSCKRKMVCPRCGKEGHAEEGCKANPCCSNCHGEHTAFSKECPIFKEEKAILQYKAQNGGTFSQARAKVFPNGRPSPLVKSFASIVKATQADKSKAAASSKKAEKTNPAGKEKRKMIPSTSEKPIKTQNRFEPLSEPDTEEVMETLNSPSSTPLPPSQSPPKLSLSPPSPSPQKSLLRGRDNSKRRMHSCERNESKMRAESLSPRKEIKAGLIPVLKPSVRPNKNKTS